METQKNTQTQNLEKVQSIWSIVWSQFKDHKMAIAGLCIIIFFVLVALSAPLISMVTGINPDEQNALNRYKGIGTYSQKSSGDIETEITNYINRADNKRAELKKELIALPQFSSFSEEDVIYELANLESATALDTVKSLNSKDARELETEMKDFSTYHIFGTDELGRDVFMRVVYGTRVSLGVGILVAITGALIGLLIGSLAGYYGGFIDTLLMRMTDSLLSLPLLPVLIVIAAIDINKVAWLRQLIPIESESIYKLVFILCLFSWMTVAMLVRSSVLSLKEREFILATKTLGATDATIILRHMFPNVIAPMLVSITLGVGESIIYEASLSFLGLGIQAPTPSWGNMLFNAQEVISEAPFLAIIPGVLILLTVISFNYLGDGLQDAVDPKARRR